MLDPLTGSQAGDHAQAVGQQPRTVRTVGSGMRTVRALGVALALAVSLALPSAPALQSAQAAPALASSAASSTIATTATVTSTQTETIHTTANHPWLTADRGWVEAGDLRPGEAVVTLDGGSSNGGTSNGSTATATVVWVHGVAGQADYYNLTVAQDHTYAVGASRAVVHNDDVCGAEGLQQMRDAVRARQSELVSSGQTDIASGVVIGDTDTGQVLFQDGPYNGNNSGYLGSKHGENQSINAAERWLQQQVARGGSGNVTVDVITHADPCGEYCSPAISSGTWLGRLQIAGGGDYTIRLRFWRVFESGVMRPAILR